MRSAKWNIVLLPRKETHSSCQQGYPLSPGVCRDKYVSSCFSNWIDLTTTEYRWAVLHICRKTYRKYCLVCKHSPAKIFKESTVRGSVSTPSASIIVMLWPSIEKEKLSPSMSTPIIGNRLADYAYEGKQLVLTSLKRWRLPGCARITARSDVVLPLHRPRPLMRVESGVLCKVLRHNSTINTGNYLRCRIGWVGVEGRCNGVIPVKKRNDRWLCE